MKKTFRILSLLMIAAMLLSFAACEDKTDNSDTTALNVGVLKGPTGVGAVNIADKAEAKKNPSAENEANIGYTEGNYNIAFYETSEASSLQANVINGSVDIAVVPINVASVLYNKTNGGIKIIATNALGVLSVVGMGEYTDIKDLKGATIYTINPGATPEYIIRYVLTQNGIDPDKDVTLSFTSAEETANDQVTKALNDAKEGKKSVAIVPEPVVTASTVQNTGMKVLFDMTEEWDKVSDSKLVQGVLIARNEVIEKNPDAIKLFVEEYGKSVSYVNENPAAAAVSIVKYGIVPKEKIAELAIPGCNVVCYNGTAMQEDVSAMFEVLYNSNPASIGGKLPDSAIYYIIETN